MAKAGKITKRGSIWYGVCLRCGDFVAAEDHPTALAVLCEHLKAYECTSAPAQPEPGALAALDRAKAGADETLNRVITQLRHRMAAGTDTTQLWNDMFEEWRQHSGNPMFAFAFATAVLRLAMA